MKTLFLRLFSAIVSMLRDRLELALELMALRHQWAVLQRSTKRPRFSPADRCLWVLLSTVWTHWTAALEIVQADTVRRWKRQGFRHHLTWQYGRKGPGRPAIPSGTRALIRRMSQENVLWGAPRIHGELAKLGVQLSRTTVAKYMAHRPGPPAQTWRIFLRNHARDLIASGAYADFSCGLRAVAMIVLHTLHRWLEQLIASRRRAVAWRRTVIGLQLRDPTAVAAVGQLGTVHRVSGGERGPPDVRWSRHWEPFAICLLMNVRTSGVYLCSSAVGCRGRNPRMPRQEKRPLKGRGRDASQRVAA